MKHDKSEECRRARRRSHIIRTAEWVLSQAYHSAPRLEILESQLRVREIVVKEAKRRIGR